MHLRREGRSAACSDTTPSSFTSIPIQWQIDEGIRIKFHRRSALQTRDWWIQGVCVPLSCFLHHFTELGEMPLSALSSDRGGAGGVSPVASGKDVCSMTHWWHICTSEIGRGWLWGMLHRFSGKRTVSYHTYMSNRGQKVTLLTAFPLPNKNQFLIRTSSTSEKEWNGDKMKTEDIHLCQIWL